MGAANSRSRSGSVMITCNSLRSGSVSRKSTSSIEHYESKPENSTSEIIEQAVCSVDDLKDNSAKNVKINDHKILIAKSEGKIYAVGSKCTHYGLPLEKGSVCNGKIRCPYHGACFNLSTGDIEDFPGLDSLPSYKVDIVNNEVKVTVAVSNLINKRLKVPVKIADNFKDQTFIVAGAGGAGIKCVESLRYEGFEGQILFLSKENFLPYDRPKISKVMNNNADQLNLRSQQFYKNLMIDLRLGESLTQVDSESKKVSTSCGNTLDYDKLFIATGGRARELNVPGSNLEGVFILRNPDDANKIVDYAKDKHVTVIGSSFIGMEVAAYLSTHDRSLSVTIIGSSSVPFERSLGAEVGGRILQWFEEKGIKFYNNSRISSIEGEEKVEKVILKDNTELESGMVIAGIGIEASTDYLKDSKVKTNERGFVYVNEHLETSVPDIFCGGDMALFPLFLNDGAPTSIGHWQMAHKHGHVAALNMLGRGHGIKSVPFFWTSLFGKSLRFTGAGPFEKAIVKGDLPGLAFIVYYCRGGRVTALAELGCPPAAAEYANRLYNEEYLTQEEVESGHGVFGKE